VPNLKKLRRRSTNFFFLHSISQKTLCPLQLWIVKKAYNRATSGVRTSPSGPTEVMAAMIYNGEEILCAKVTPVEQKS
jgi:hypothetical protein